MHQAALQRRAKLLQQASRRASRTHLPVSAAREGGHRLQHRWLSNDRLHSLGPAIPTGSHLLTPLLLLLPPAGHGIPHLASNQHWPACQGLRAAWSSSQQRLLLPQGQLGLHGAVRHASAERVLG